MKAVFASIAMSATLAAFAVSGSEALAALPIGAAAPDFVGKASLGGKEFDFSLSAALKKGPVVLYFYPAAFTKGCTIEAHDFAEATAKFKALGAAVIGVSHDNIATLDKFSVSECRKKFAVVADPTEVVIKEYDAVLAKNPAYADRTSYVISPDGKVLFTYTNLDPDQHVALTLAAVKKWKSSKSASASP
ncbi:MAG: peroxiredoxin [Alphaproteobacteria bacterium]|nr:peroxiredoxin [Alphaproteobacteria bacterium]